MRRRRWFPLLAALLAAVIPVPGRAEESAPAAPAAPAKEEKKLETTTFAGGCFWCVEAVFQRIKGVEKVRSGYTAGTVKNPTYEQVCEGTTGHAEAVEITFDPAVASFEKLVRLFFEAHDPTTLNRQGADVGTQYRSAIYWHSPGQKETAERVKKELDASGKFKDPIVTEIAKAEVFYEAEKYHQNYYNLNSNKGYCRAVIAPKLKKLGLETK